MLFWYCWTILLWTLLLTSCHWQLMLFRHRNWILLLPAPDNLLLTSWQLLECHTNLYACQEQKETGFKKRKRILLRNELENHFHKHNLRHLPRFPDFFVTFRILSPSSGNLEIHQLLGLTWNSIYEQNNRDLIIQLSCGITSYLLSGCNLKDSTD